MKESVTVAVDFMGDDIESVIEGAEAASSEISGHRIIVVGPASVIPQIRNAQFVFARDYIKMDEDDVSRSLREHPNASINVACRLVKEGNASAVVSAGNSKATVLSAINTFGMIEGIRRPAIALAIPSKVDKTVLIDVGATIDAKPEWMLQWAILGSIYARFVLKKDDPKVGLLSIGTERAKVNRLVQDSHRLFEKSQQINFVGNVEYIFSGGADVVVCDGFVGNVVLKNLEDGLSFFPTNRCFEADYAFYGGALLLGVNGIVIIAHGKSSPKAIERAINVAIEAVNSDVIKKIQDALRP